MKRHSPPISTADEAVAFADAMRRAVENAKARSDEPEESDS